MAKGRQGVLRPLEWLLVGSRYPHPKPEDRHPILSYIILLRLPLDRLAFETIRRMLATGYAPTGPPLPLILGSQQVIVRPLWVHGRRAGPTLRLQP